MRREDSKALQRQGIIEATLDCIAEHGISGTTISRIVARAGIARGMVNLYFGSKETLMLEVLRELNRRYFERLDHVFADPATPALQRMMNYIDTELDPEIFNLRYMSAWFAFRGEASSHPEYMSLIENRDPAMEARIATVFSQNLPVGEQSQAILLAQAFMLLVEGLYTDFRLHPQQFDRVNARNICAAFIGRIIPAK